MIRTPIALIPYALAVAAILGGLLWHAGDRVAQLGATTQSGTALVGGPFKLIDQDGHARSDADYRGRYLLIYFGYSFCPDVCPTTLALMGNALDRLGPKRTRIVPMFVTVDPERDTPQVLKPYMKSFGPDFVGLTGDRAHIKQVAREYHVYIAKHPLPGGNYAMDHSGVIYLMGPDGKFVTYYEDTLGPDGIAGDLKRRL
ncbi:MAG TPA: SCO family protein [Rhizomicrobium sp.]|nr:SCO family protein [Rhizomicrobium sp.]